MELKEFITQTLVQITAGVVEAQNLVKETGCIINPISTNVTDSKSIIRESFKNDHRQIQNIKMSISIAVTEGNGQNSGIGVVASVFKAGVSNDKKESNEVINRIEFEIPVALPVMAGKEIPK